MPDKAIDAGAGGAADGTPPALDLERQQPSEEAKQPATDTTSNPYVTPNPEHIAGGTDLAEHRKIRGGAVRVLVDLGHAPANVTDHLNARWPDSFEQSTLRISGQEPLLVLTR